MDAIRRPRCGCPPNLTEYLLINEAKVIRFIKIKSADKEDSYTRYLIVEEKLDGDTS